MRMRLPAITVIESASITPTPVHPNFQLALTPFDGHLTKVGTRGALVNVSPADDFLNWSGCCGIGATTIPG